LYQWLVTKALIFPKDSILQALKGLLGGEGGTLTLAVLIKIPELHAENCEASANPRSISWQPQQTVQVRIDAEFLQALR
jgi:hypothetical protein